MMYYNCCIFVRFLPCYLSSNIIHRKKDKCSIQVAVDGREGDLVSWLAGVGLSLVPDHTAWLG